MSERLEQIKTNWNNYHMNTSDVDWLIEQAEKVKEYENIIHAIANIDTMFMNPDGTDREFNHKEALEEIEKMVMPIWNKYCEEFRKELEEDIRFLVCSSIQRSDHMRPKTAQTVIDTFTKLIDEQCSKGLSKYGTTIDEAKDENYDWNRMALEESIDLAQYLVKENAKLQKQLEGKCQVQRTELLEEHIERLEKVNERYREALMKILNTGTLGTDIHTGKVVRKKEAEIAFKALEGGK